MRMLPSLTLALLCLGIALVGCASYRPETLESVGLLQRAQTSSHNGLSVTVSVPSDAESERLFGVSLARHGIQPVWLEIANYGSADLWFSPHGLDPGYFTPLEVANRCRYRFSAAANERLREHLLAAALDPAVGRGERNSGFVFTNLDRGVKAVNVDLIGRQRFEQFFFLVEIPGFHADYKEVDAATLYRPEEVRDLGEDDLRAALEQLPCCATTEDGRGIEDPLNFVLIGTTREVFPNFARAGWHVTETLRAAAGLATFWSYFFGAEYKHAPISPVFLFGRRQDIALQKARETARERNHLRIWLAPLRFHGSPVWVGQISRDIGLQLGWKNIVGHEVDPDVDEARDYLVQDMLRTQGMRQFGWVKGVGATPATAPRSMSDGTPFFTDGLRAVMVFGHEPTPLERIDLFGWEMLR